MLVVNMNILNEINFNKVFQVEQADEQEIDDHDVPGLEKLPSLMQNKEESTFSIEELIDVNIGTSDQERMVKIWLTLTTPYQERYKSKFIEYHKNFACSYSDTSNLDKSFIMYSLPLKEKAKPIK